MTQSPTTARARKRAPPEPVGAGVLEARPPTEPERSSRGRAARRSRRPPRPPTSAVRWDGSFELSTNGRRRWRETLAGETTAADYLRAANAVSDALGLSFEQALESNVPP